MLCRAGLVVWFAIGMGGAGCGEYEETFSLFELPGTGDSGFYALPFPNDLRLDPDGTVSFEGHPRPNDLLGLYLDTIDERLVGFGLNPITFFRFSAPLDPDSFPETPRDSLDDSASIYLVDVDGSSPAYGRRTPLRFRFGENPGSVIGDNWLAAQTYPGFVLREHNTYAVVVSDRIRDHHGQAVSPAPAFTEIMNGGGGDAVAAVYAPLLAYLQLADIDPASVTTATVFTTQQATLLLENARKVVRSQAPPPFFDVRKVSERTHYRRYEGMWRAPNFQSGESPFQSEGGSIEVDEDGLPIIQRFEDLRFSISVPKGTHAGRGWPLVLYSHGTGGDYRTYVNNGTAKRLARRGIATLSMDQVFHGPRIPPGGDSSLLFFNFLNPLAARDNSLQGSIDLLNQTFFAENLTINDVDLGVVHNFDASRIGFFGHSQGGITGTPFLAAERNVRGGILSGAGGLLYLSLLDKTEPIDITALVSLLIRDEPLDEFNPMLAVLQMYLDRGDAVNYAHKIVLSPPDSGRPKHIYQSEGFIDRFTPKANIEALAVALGSNLVGPRVAPVEGLELAGREELAAPVAGNVNGATSVLVQYEAPEDTDGHFVLFREPVAMEQSIDFIQELLVHGTPTVYVPTDTP